MIAELKAGALPPYGMPGFDGPGEVPEPRLPEWMMGPEGGPPPMPKYDLKIAADIKNGKVQVTELENVSLTGEVGDKSASGVKLVCDCEYVNGVMVESGEYEITDSEFYSKGDGANDFAGVGSAIMTDGDGALVLRNVNVTTAGCIRPCTCAAGDSVLKVYNCTLTGEGGTLPEDYKPVIGPGMMQAPPGLGIGGNCRTHLSLGNSRSYFYDSTIIADGWAVLSTDGCTDQLFLEAHNCDVICRNSGYGIYSDGGCVDWLDNCRIKTATHGGIMAGDCDLKMTGCTMESGQYGVMLHTVMGTTSELGRLYISDCDIHTGDAALFMKSTNEYISIENSRITSDSGVLFHSIINDDECATFVPEGEDNVYGVKIAVTGCDLTGDAVRMDTQRHMSLSLKNSSLKGAVEDCWLAMDDESSLFVTRDCRFALVGGGRIDAPEGVTVTVVPAAGCTAVSGKLPSGGMLAVED